MKLHLNLKYILAVPFTFLFWGLSAQAPSDTLDYLKINKIDIVPDIISKNVTGTRVILNSELIFRKIKGRIEKPYQVDLHVDFFDSNGKAVPAITRTRLYRSDGLAVINQTMYGKETNLFIPYYALDLDPGEHNLKMKLSVTVKDSSTTSTPRAISCLGDSIQTFTINKPKTREISVVARGIRIAATDANGTQWDWGLSGLEPDIIYKLILSSEEASDYLFVSTVMKNSFSAAWMDFSEPVTLSEKDRITVGVYDKDALFDDPAGAKDFSIEELKKAADDRSEFAVGQVSYLLLDMKESAK